MSEFHTHLHLDRKLLADPKGSIHVHLTSEGQASEVKAFSEQAAGAEGIPQPSGHATGLIRSGWALLSSGSVGKAKLQSEQRVRTKMYRMEVVPAANQDDIKSYAKLFSEPETSKGLMLELATGNQVDPIVWESFKPHSQRGLWRLSVREESGRFLGIMTHARDPRAIWILPDWTPRGTLVLVPLEAPMYPRLMLTPVPALQR